MNEMSDKLAVLMNNCNLGQWIISKQYNKQMVNQYD